MTSQIQELIDERISIRTGNALTRGGINTVEQINAFTDRELLSLEGLGRKSLNEIQDLLLEFGYVLRNGRQERQENEEKRKSEKKRLMRLKSLWRYSRRNLYIYRERALNKRTLSDISAEIGLSSERIRQIVATICRVRDYRSKV